MIRALEHLRRRWRFGVSESGVPTSGQVVSLPEDDLRAHLAERLVRYKIPRTFEFTTEPLRDDAGKSRRSALRTERLAT